MQDHSTIEPAGGKRGGRYCSYVGCEGRLHANELWSGHYKRQKNGKPMDPTIGKRAPNGTVCAVDECVRLSKSKVGYCNTYNHRFQRMQDMDYPIHGYIKEHLPVGTLRPANDGYVEVKVAKGGKRTGWDR